MDFNNGYAGASTSVFDDTMKHGNKLQSLVIKKSYAAFHENENVRTFIKWVVSVRKST